MRSEEEIISLLLKVAENDNRIRAVLLTGSRANPNVVKDDLQDFDVIYLVTAINTFTTDHSWIDVFGERLILQLPDEMTMGEWDKHAFHYLMLFADGNRIDVTLFPLDRLNKLLEEESLLQLLLDKDQLIKNMPPPSERQYFIQPPAEQVFADCCNEFWWVSTYVAKGLLRKEIPYAKAMMEGPVRAMFLKIIEWYVGANTGFLVSFGKSGRHMQRYLSPQVYHQILATYPDGNINNMWTALHLMTFLFDKMAKETARKLNFCYNKKEAMNVTSYLKKVNAMFVKK